MSHIVIAEPADTHTVTRLIRTLCCQYYPLLQSVPIGTSVCGRPIEALVLGHGKHYVLITAAFHAQEWLTSLIALRLCEDLCRFYCTGEKNGNFDFSQAGQLRTVVIVPQVNPDGVDIAIHGSIAAGCHADLLHALGADIHGFWQANAAGIDINHNFDAGRLQLRELESRYGFNGPRAGRWGGTHAESEPETKALCNLCRRLPFAHVVALHSQGEEIYWQYGERTPLAAKQIACTFSELSGYTVATPDAIASHGGFKDWFIEQTGRPGFTFELGKGRNPLPLEEFESIYAKAQNMLLYAAMM